MTLPKLLAAATSKQQANAPRVCDHTHSTLSLRTTPPPVHLDTSMAAYINHSTLKHTSTLMSAAGAHAPERFLATRRRLAGGGGRRRRRLPAAACCCLPNPPAALADLLPKLRPQRCAAVRRLLVSLTCACGLGRPSFNRAAAAAAARLPRCAKLAGGRRRKAAPQFVWGNNPPTQVVVIIARPHSPPARSKRCAAGI